jgi:hypothetical protein
MTTTSHHVANGTEPSPASVAAKVRKLLAKAQRTSNEAEAEAFSRKAAQLMAAHRLDPERLVQSPDDHLDTIEIGLGRGPYVRARLALVTAIASSSGCAVVYRSEEAGTIAMVAGYRSDLEALEAMYSSLHAQAAIRMAQERSFDAAATLSWRRSFLFGYANEIQSMLEESMRAESRGHPEGGDRLMPAVVDRDRRVREFADSAWGPTRRARQPARPNMLGYLAGQREAGHADLGRRRVPQRGALNAGE